MPKRSKPIEDELCERISKGETLRAICRDKHMPNWSAVYQWMEKDEEFAKRIAHARDLGYDAIAEETMEIVDAVPERGPDNKIDSGYVQWQKNRAYQRMQLLSKWSPKKYGEKREVEHKGEISLLESIVAHDYDD